ncbi:Puromycin-sensitive aminopeptidase [Taenia crassiceps]|uniref:Puromycin-sensitive aminopeptidase n=1 Tax=Taenia crassiceps TaxID=6207 RepID=A0ABR4PZF1_9CEST
MGSPVLLYCILAGKLPQVADSSFCTSGPNILAHFLPQRQPHIALVTNLGATTNAEIMRRLFDLAFTERVRKQDRLHLLVGVTESAGGGRALWNLVRDRFATLCEDVNTSHLLATVLKCSTASFASKKRYDEIKAFFEEHDVPCPRMIEQTLESVKINAQLWQRDGEVVCNFLHTLLH